MRARSLALTRWHAHVNGANPPPELRYWLTGQESLTAKLSAHSQRFRVQRLHQRQAPCLGDEAAVIGLTRQRMVWEREVLLRCDERPVVFAHTVVPLSATASDWPLFSALGERSLGTTLFGDPLVRRGPLHFARLRAGHPLVARARRALLRAAAGMLDAGLGVAVAAMAVDAFDLTLFARRSLYRRKNGLLLVTEVFLPGIKDLRGQDWMAALR